MANGKLIGLATALTVGVSFAHAQSIRPSYSYPAAPQGSGPASIQVGQSPFYFSPYAAVAFGHDDNVFLSRNNPKTSNLVIASPGLSIDARSERSVFLLKYQAQIGRYSSSENDNYEDQSLRGQFDVAFDRRNFLRVDADLVLGHDPRGSTDRPLSSEPDRWRVTKPGLLYAFGTPGAAGRVETYYSDTAKRFRNNRATTALGDYNRREFGGAVYVRVAPKTYAVVEARDARIKYVENTGLNADERKYFGGIAWEASATTTGVVKVGRFQRKQEGNQPDFSDIGWEAELSWSPRTYSRFALYTSRFSTEPSGVGTFIVSDATGVTWSHSWNSVVTTGVDLKYQRDDYQGFNRKDDTMSLGIKVGYRFRRWLTFGAEYAYTKRDSNLENSEYDKNLYFLTATASM